MHVNIVNIINIYRSILHEAEHRVAHVITFSIMGEDQASYISPLVLTLRALLQGGTDALKGCTRSPNHNHPPTNTHTHMHTHTHTYQMVRTKYFDGFNSISSNLRTKEKHSLTQ